MAAFRPHLKVEIDTEGLQEGLKGITTDGVVIAADLAPLEDACRPFGQYPGDLGLWTRTRMEGASKKAGRGVKVDPRPKRLKKPEYGD